MGVTWILAFSISAFFIAHMVNHNIDFNYIKMCVELSTFQPGSQQFDSWRPGVKIPPLFQVCL